MTEETRRRCLEPFFTTKGERGTGLGMPYLDGRKVGASIAAASAHTPVILPTGWGQRLLSENEIPPHLKVVPSKPPKMHEVRAALAAVSGGSLSR